MQFALIFLSFYFVIIYGLIFLCFSLPYKCGFKKIGISIGVILGLITTVGFFELVFLIRPSFLFGMIFAELIFICFWTFRLFGKPKFGFILTTILSCILIGLIVLPWVADFLFNKRDVNKILFFHNIQLKDNFSLVSNNSTRGNHPSQTFTIQLSDYDYDRIIKEFRGSKKYKGLIETYLNLPSESYNGYDTTDYETPDFVERICTSRESMKNGMNHFQFQLNKKTKELTYTGETHY